MSHSFLKIHQKRQNDVLCGNRNMDVSPMSGNYAIGRTPNFSANISHTYENAIEQKEPLRGVPWKYLFLIFKKYRVITYIFRKILG